MERSKQEEGEEEEIHLKLSKAVSWTDDSGQKRTLVCGPVGYFHLLKKQLALSRQTGLSSHLMNGCSISGS